MSRIQSIIDAYNESDEAIARELQLAVANYMHEHKDLVILSGLSMHPTYKAKLTNNNQFKVVRKNKIYTVTITTDE